MPVDEESRQGVAIDTSRPLKALVTDVRHLEWLSRLVGVPVLAKCEHTQVSGSFKYRGALLALAAASRPVIVGSAGNHGLAIATAARELGVDALVVVPTNASRLKRDRIAATGAAVIEHGRSVDQAIEEARRLAHLNGWSYVSPYNHELIIAGATELGREFLSQAPQIRTLICPIGGGGLATGLAAALSELAPKRDLLGWEPERHAGMSQSFVAGKITQVLERPTLADGLSINMDKEAITFDAVRRSVDKIITLSEEELAAGTLALLARESMLVEPSGAAGVVAALRFNQQIQFAGPVGILLTGGNMQRSSLSRILGWDIRDPELLYLTQLRGPRTEDVVVAPSGHVGQSTGHAQVVTPEASIDTQLVAVDAELVAAADDLLHYRNYLVADSLWEPRGVVDDLTSLIAMTRARVTTARQDLLSEPDDVTLAMAEAQLKTARATLAHVRGALEWSSASYGQSMVPQFFNTRSQDSPTLNYDRYEHDSVMEVERQLERAVGDGGATLAVSAVSSGMAAYTVLESFLVRHRLRPGDTVMLPPYLYFEVEEQLLSLPGLTIVRAEGYDTDDFVKGVRSYRPRCLFLDPVANNAQQRVLDVPAIIGRLRRDHVRRMTIVIDGTMTPGAIDPSMWRSDNNTEVLYYESGSKYLQMGLDSSMAGMILYPLALKPVIERLRRNTGAILYRNAAIQFPRYEPEIFRSRMTRVATNAFRMASEIERRIGSTIGRVYYPGLQSHPDHANARGLQHSGGCLTFLFDEPGRNHRDYLNSMIDEVISAAGRRQLPITKGVSFGFTVPRISAASSMAETEPPFLRVYAGDMSRGTTDGLAAIIAERIARSTTYG